MKSLTGSVLCLILFFLTATSLNAQSKLDELSTRRAKSAVKSYQKVIVEAQEDFEQEVAKAREELIETLGRELKSETSDGNFDNAIKIKAAIEQLEKEAESGATQKKLPPDLSGVWKIQFTNGLIRYQVFTLRNGQPYTLRSVEINGKIDDEGPVSIREGKIYVKYKVFAQLVERYTIDGDRMIVEHWDLNIDKSVDRFPNLMAIATRVNEEKK